jgi:ABC-type transport system involved in cytochrome bd biosynthesis fused ATPase/permease subunit
MLGLSLDQATNIALIVATGFVVAAVAVFWVMKTIVQKLVVAVLLALLAFATWSQRASLQDCADKVETNLRNSVDVGSTDQGAADTSETDTSETDTSTTDTMCRFFGVDVDVS